MPPRTPPPALNAMEAAIVQTERVDATRCAADKHVLSDNRRLGTRRGFAIESERPFQRKRRGLLGREPWLSLKSIVRLVERPSHSNRPRQARPPTADRTVQAGPPDVPEELPTTGRAVENDTATARRLRRREGSPCAHQAARQRVVNAIGGKRADDVARRNADCRVVVT